ncbi:MAG TPA: PIG-L family deacetylase [Vicinamibacterales bacterium]|jgi:LmbE family N-acetylglucosaminyl deacetylase|nr:PIG-L family deacetylase [Vicinamibacterales bacterium]
MRTRVAVVVAVLVGVAISVQGPAGAQVRPVYDMGAAGLVQLLERLQTTASVLHTGAHPDDEDSSFLARMARGDHARTAYLSLNRGEGGQNIIGTELFDALGVIRTEELLQARRLDGGEQFFTRSFDYGFSKTRTEAAAKWDEQALLGDMVRVIRTFRPLVVYARFSGTPQDGHGQHQMAGYLTPLAFKAAADPAQFPEQITEGLRPWQSTKLYRGAPFRADPENQPTMSVQTGIVDAALGRTYAEIAAEGRSQHKSQEMGGIEPMGPAASGLILLSPAPDAAVRERSVFDGIDVSLAGLSAISGLPAGSLRSELADIQTAARQALATYQPLDPSRIVPPLAAGLSATRAARRALQALDAGRDAKADADFLLSLKEREFADALVRAAGVVVDPLSDAETVTPGGSLIVSARTFLAYPGIVTITNTVLRAPAGWRVAPAPPPANANNQGGPPGRREQPTAETRYAVTVAADASLTQPYFLREPRRGDMYQWPVSSERTMPFEAAPLNVEVTAEIGGATVAIARPVQYRTGDRVRGELRREINVVPAVTVGVDSRLLIVPTGSAPNTQRIVVRATNLTDKAVKGVLRLRLPQGWVAEPAEAPLVLAKEGENGAASFVVRAPVKRVEGTLDLTAEAVVNGVSYSRDLQTIAYPHIQTHRVYAPAAVKVQVFDLKVAAVKVGYIMGSGDQVPDALRRMGLDVTLVDPEMLSSGDLSRFDTIVVGVRASEARPDFVANTGRLRDYMERGGTLIVQYQQTDYINRGLPPYPVKVEGNPRITDETAAVKILVPRHPVFAFPNTITDADFQGWVQERNLYSFGTFDGKYTPLLEASDPGEDPQRGGEVYADVGKGRYVYTSYAWFRQLPAGVPGAYRMFANLVSLSKALH